MTTRDDVRRPYADAWGEYRRRSRLAWPLFFGFIPFLALVALVTRTGDGGGDFIFGIAGLIWATVWIVTSFRLGRFRCRRCKRDYFYKWPVQNGFARRCLHCGLRKWAVHDDDSLPAPARRDTKSNTRQRADH